MFSTSGKALTLGTFCWQNFVLDRLGCYFAQDRGGFYERWRQTHYPQGDRQWRLAQWTHCGLHGKTYCLDWCQVSFATRFPLHCIHTHTVYLFFMAAYVHFLVQHQFLRRYLQLDDSHDCEWQIWYSNPFFSPVFEHTLARQWISFSVSTNFVLGF